MAACMELYIDTLGGLYLDGSMDKDLPYLVVENLATLLQTDNHASTPTTQFFYRPDALPAAQPTASKHQRQ